MEPDKRKRAGIKKGVRVSYEDIAHNYPAEKAQLSLTRNPWGYFVVRPISFRITPFFINLGVSANAVTTLGLVLNLCGLVFIAFGAVNRYSFIIGAIIINIASILDRVDGNIARFRNQCSKFGEMFDAIVGMFSTTLLPICLGIGLYFGAKSSISIWGKNFSGLFWLLIGIADSCIYLFRRAVSLKYQISTNRKALSSKSKIVSVLSALPLSLKQPLLIVVLLIGALDFFMVGYMVYSLITLFIMLKLCLGNVNE